MCTEFILPKITGRRISGRTMDFQEEYPFSLFAAKSGTLFNREGNDLESLFGKYESGKTLLSWESRFDIVGTSTFMMTPGDQQDTNEQSALERCKIKIKDIDTKGCLQSQTDLINSEGLSAALLWLPGSEYPSIYTKTDNESYVISSTDICLWAVSQFKSIKELNSALQNIKSGQPVKVYNKGGLEEKYIFLCNLFQKNKHPNGETTELINESQELPTHYQFHDKEGNSLVLEFRNGEMEITTNVDNDCDVKNGIGVMTNSPFLDWHLDNLGNYLGVTNQEVERATLFSGTADKEHAGVTIKRNGNGGGTVGVSMSPLPSERFIRAAGLLDFACAWLADAETKDSEAISFAQKVLGNVEVPKEMCLDTSPSAAKFVGDFTQWKVIRIHEALKNDDVGMYVMRADSLGCWKVGLSKIIEQCDVNAPVYLDFPDEGGYTAYPKDTTSTEQQSA